MRLLPSQCGTMDLPKHLCGEPTSPRSLCFLQPSLQPVAASGKLCGTSNRVCCNMTKKTMTKKTETENKTSAESAAKTKKKTKADIIAAANAAGIARTHYTRDEACAPANMSESQLRILRKLGFGPKETGLGRSVRFPVGP